MSASPSLSSLRSGDCGTAESTSTVRAKKRTVVVVRRPKPKPHDIDDHGGSGHVSRKKTLMVSRRPRLSEGRLFDNSPGSRGGKRVGVVEGSNNNPTFGNMRWSTDGRVLERSILGTAEAFEQMDGELGQARAPPADDDEPLDAGSCGTTRTPHTQQSRQGLFDGSDGTRDSSLGEYSNRPGTSSDGHPGLHGVQRDIRRYMRRIVEAEKTATRNKAERRVKDTKLLEHIGLTEKLTLEREGNAMRQWERRQRDWLRVREDMATKIGKAPENLVMSTGDDFRERREAYQLIQSAIPANEKFSSDGYWVMSLRGYGARVCNVGNIFSGLCCALDERVPPSRTVRKPTGRAADVTRKRTWRNSTALARRQKQLAPALEKLRPANLDAEDTGGLLVRGHDLLEWAASSSKDYFELRHIQELESELAQLRELENTEAGEIDENENEFDIIPPRRSRSGPAMEIISPKFLLIETNAGADDITQSAVIVRNTGSTALYFTWSRVHKGETIVSANRFIGGPILSPPSDKNNDDYINASAKGSPPVAEKRVMTTGDGNVASASPGYAFLEASDHRFFCHQTTGTLLPGERTTTRFSFKSTDAGVFSDCWRLETIPPAPFVFTSPPTASESLQGAGRPSLSALASSYSTTREVLSVGVQDRMDGDVYDCNKDEDCAGGDGGQGAVEVKKLEMEEGAAEVGLRGLALTPDTREHARRRLAASVEKGVLAAKVEELVREIVRGVRTPVREEEIRRRQRQEFLSANSERGLFFTPHLYDSFAGLLQRVKVVALGAKAGEYDQLPTDAVLADETEEAAARTQDRQESRTLTNVQGNCMVLQQGETSDKPLAEALLTKMGKTDDVDEHSVASSQTRSASASSSSVVDGSDMGHDSELDRAAEGPSPQEVMESVSDDEHAEIITDETPVMEERGDDKYMGDRGKRDGQTEETAASNIEELKAKLESLDRGDWNGSVDVVLDKIEELSRWIPVDEPVKQQPSEENNIANQVEAAGLEMGVDGPGLDAHKTNGIIEGKDNPNKVAGEKIGDGYVGSEGQSRDGSEQEEGEDEGDDEDDENDEDDEDDENDEDDEDDEEDGDESGDDDEGGEDDQQFVEDEDEVWSAQQHPLIREQRVLRAQWRRLLLDAELEPETSIFDLMRSEIVTMLEAVPDAVEEARREAVALPGGTPATPRQRPVLRYDEDSIKTWAAACPENTFSDFAQGGARARAAALAKGGDSLASFAALAFDAVSSEVEEAVARFEAKLRTEEADRRSASAARRFVNVVEGPVGIGHGDAQSSAVVPPPLSRVATLSRSDIEGQRLLLHVDLCQRNEEVRLKEGNRPDGVGTGGASAADRRHKGGGGEEGRGPAERTQALEPMVIVDDSSDGGRGGGAESHAMLFPEAVQLVAEEVRSMLSAKPSAVAIVSETASGPVSAHNTILHTGPTPHPSLGLLGGSWVSTSDVISPTPVEALTNDIAPATSSPSALRATSLAVSTLLGMDVEFYDSIPEMATALGECDMSGSDPHPLAVRVMMVEGLGCPGVVPAPPVEEPELSDCEDERLPDFTWGGQDEVGVAAEKEEAVEAGRLKRNDPSQGDLGELLAGTVDVTVLDAPRTLYRPKRNIPWGPTPTTGLTVSGTALHGDLNAMAYLTEMPDRPLLAIVGGGCLEPRLQLVDGLLDLVDTLAIGGAMSVTLLAALRAEENVFTGGGGGGGGGRKRIKKWGKDCAGLPRDPVDVFVAARRLIVKARKRGVKVILPTDFVVGDIAVDEFGPLMGTERPQEGDDDEGEKRETDNDTDGINHQRSDGGDTANAASAARPAEGGFGGTIEAATGDGEDDTIGATADPEDEPAAGFEYEGETMDVSVEEGIPRGFRAMDIGPQTTAMFTSAVAQSRSILWHGMLGVAECTAFQSGTREVLEAATTAHDSDELREVGASPVVVLCGRSLGLWAGKLIEAEGDAPRLGAGSGVSHVCTDPRLCSRVLEGRYIPGLRQLSVRDPAPGDADLGKVLRRRPFGDDDDEEDGEDDDGEDEDQASGDDSDT